MLPWVVFDARSEAVEGGQENLEARLGLPVAELQRRSAGQTPCASTAGQKGGAKARDGAMKPFIARANIAPSTQTFLSSSLLLRIQGRNSQSTFHTRKPLKIKPYKNQRAERPGASSHARFFALPSNLQPLTSRIYPRHRTSRIARKSQKTNGRANGYPRHSASQFRLVLRPAISCRTKDRSATVNPCRLPWRRRARITGCESRITSHKSRVTNDSPLPGSDQEPGSRPADCARCRDATHRPRLPGKQRGGIVARRFRAAGVHV